MESLVRNGGEGEFVRFNRIMNIEGPKDIVQSVKKRYLKEVGGAYSIDGESARVGQPGPELGKGLLRVLSPPRNKIYTTAFDEVFQEFDRAGVPVFIDPHMASDAYAYMTFTHQLSPKTQAAAFFRPQMDHLTLRHELQHLRDFKTRIGEFQRELPELPNSILDILKKQNSGKKLSGEEEMKYDLVGKILLALAEVRADEQGVKSLFTAKGFKEMRLSKNRRRDLLHYLKTVDRYESRNIQFLSYSLMVDPLNPKNLIILAKLAPVGGGLALVGVGGGALLVYVFRELKAVGMAYMGS